MTAEQYAAQLATATTRTAAEQLVAPLKGAQLQTVAAAAGVKLQPAITVADKRQVLVDRTVGYRLNSAAIRKL